MLKKKRQERDGHAQGTSSRGVVSRPACGGMVGRGIVAGIADSKLMAKPRR